MVKPYTRKKNTKLNSCHGNYWRRETIQGRKIFAEIQYRTYGVWFLKFKCDFKMFLVPWFCVKKSGGLNSRTYVPLDICILRSQCRKSSFHLDNRQHYCIHFPIVHPDNLCKLKRINVLKFRYSEKATKIWPIFHFSFDIT